MLHELVPLGKVVGSGRGHADSVDVEAITWRLGGLEVALVDVVVAGVVLPVVGRGGGLFQGRSRGVAPELFHVGARSLATGGSSTCDESSVEIAQSSRLHALSPLGSATGND